MAAMGSLAVGALGMSEDWPMAIDVSVVCGAARVKMGMTWGANSSVGHAAIVDG